MFPDITGLESAPPGNFSHPKHIRDSSPPINELVIQSPEKCQPAVAEKQAIMLDMERYVFVPKLAHLELVSHNYGKF